MYSKPLEQCLAHRKSGTCFCYFCYYCVVIPFSPSLSPMCLHASVIPSQGKGNGELALAFLNGCGWTSRWQWQDNHSLSLGSGSMTRQWQSAWCGPAKRSWCCWLCLQLRLWGQDIPSPFWRYLPPAPMILLMSVFPRRRTKGLRFMVKAWALMIIWTCFLAHLCHLTKLRDIGVKGVPLPLWALLLLLLLSRFSRVQLCATP